MRFLENDRQERTISVDANLVGRYHSPVRCLLPWFPLEARLMSQFALSVSPAVRHQLEFLVKLTRAGIDFGYEFNVHNGDGLELLPAPSWKWKEIGRVINQTGGDIINVYQGGNLVGWLAVEWVNNPEHYLHTWTESIEDLIDVIDC